MGDPVCGFCNQQIVNIRGKSIKCSGFCDKLFHATCVSVPADIIKNVDKVPGLSWNCTSCYEKSKDMHAFFETKLSEILNQVETIFSSFKDEFVQIANKKLNEFNISSDSHDKKLYSAVARSKPAVIITPKDTQQKNAVTKSDILHNINPVQSELNLSGIKNTKNGGVLIGCNKADDISKFKQLASEKLGGKYEIKEVGNFCPRIRVVGMAEKFPEGDLVQYIQFQNKNLVSNNFHCNVMEIKPIKKRSDIYQALLQIDVESYNNIMSVGRGKLFLGYDVCDVYDAIQIKRCFKCSGFSHFSNQCTCQQCYCPRCGDNHLVKDCKSESLKCINCSKYNLDKNTNIDTNHAAWDSRCFCYVQKLNEFKSSLLFSK